MNPLKLKNNIKSIQVITIICNFETNKAEKMSNKKEVTSSYIHEKSNIVPEWVKQLADLKEKIRSDIHAPNNETKSGIKYLHPFDVPRSAKQ